MSKRLRMFGRTLYVEVSRTMKDFGQFQVEGPKQARLKINARLPDDVARKSAIHEASHAADWLIEEHRAHANEEVTFAVLAVLGLWGETE